MSDVDYGPAFRPQGVNWNNAEQTVGTVNFQDKNTHAIFYMNKSHNPAKSQEQGHPIYDNVVYVRIGNPGERLNVVDRPATQGDQRRFPVQWAQFQQNMEQRPSGTPVSILFSATRLWLACLRAVTSSRWSSWPIFPATPLRMLAWVARTTSIRRSHT